MTILRAQVSIPWERKRKRKLCLHHEEKRSLLHGAFKRLWHHQNLLITLVVVLSYCCNFKRIESTNRQFATDNWRGGVAIQYGFFQTKGKRRWLAVCGCYYCLSRYPSVITTRQVRQRRSESSWAKGMHCLPSECLNCRSKTGISVDLVERDGFFAVRRTVVVVDDVIGGTLCTNFRLSRSKCDGRTITQWPTEFDQKNLHNPRLIPRKILLVSRR